MKTYKSITRRYLKGQKNRTLLTLFGIILSVALITAIGTMVVSVRDVMIEDAIDANGSFHAKFNGIDEETVGRLRNHVDIESVGETKLTESLALEKTSKEEKISYALDIPYRTIDLRNYDSNAQELLPINLGSGRLPENKNEIAIEKWNLEFFDQDLELGDKVKFLTGKRLEAGSTTIEDIEIERERFEELGLKEFKIVGFIEPRYVWRGNLATDGIVGGDGGDSSSQNAAYIKLNNIKGANGKIEQIASDLGIPMDNITYNNELLRLSAQGTNDRVNKSLVSILVFVVALIIVSTIAVIYNAFNISVIERISQFGLFRSIGATPKQIKNLVYREAFLLTVIAIPLGFGLGVIAMKVVLYIISLIQDDIALFENMKISISPIVFLVTSVLASITVFLSARGPARRASKVSPLEAIKNTKDVKKEKIKKTGNTGIIRKLFGIEGEIAYKNLNRNKKRFIITVFSMVLSIVLFITFSSFSDFLFQSSIIDSAEMADFEVYGNIGAGKDDVISKIKSSKEVGKLYNIERKNGSVALDKSKINKKLLEVEPSIFEEKDNGKIEVPNVEITTIGDENLDSLDELLKAGNIDVKEMNEKDGVLVINKTYDRNYGGSSNGLIKGYNLEVGDHVPFSPYENYDAEGNEKIESKELKVIGVLDRGILDEKYNPNGSIKMITTGDVLNSFKEESTDSYTSLYLQLEEGVDKKNVVDLLKEVKEDTPGLNFIDYAQQAREMRNVNIIINIFLYGFVAIISIISAINIINTISTNIILRRKEIAMAKAVGMTNRGIKKMVSFESIFYGLYAGVLGTVLGVGLSYILYRLIGGIRQFPYVFPLKNVIIATIGAAVIAVVSGIYPLRRINDKIIVESMKDND